MVLWQAHAYGGGGGKAPFRAGIAMSGSSNAIASTLNSVILLSLLQD